MYSWKPWMTSRVLKTQCVVWPMQPCHATAQRHPWRQPISLILSYQCMHRNAKPWCLGCLDLNLFQGMPWYAHFLGEFIHSAATSVISCVLSCIPGAFKPASRELGFTAKLAPQSAASRPRNSRVAKLSLAINDTCRDAGHRWKELSCASLGSGRFQRVWPVYIRLR